MNRPDATIKHPIGPQTPRTRGGFFFSIAVVLVVGIPLVVLSAWTKRSYWFDLASHFVPHSSAAVLVLAAASALLRRWVIAAGLGLCAVAAFGLCFRDARLPASPRAEGAVTTLRVIHYNMYGYNSRHDNEFIKWLRDQDADLIGLVDAPLGLLDDYPFLKEQYPYFVEPKPGLQWVTVLLSRFPAEITPLAPYREEVKFSFIARRSLVVTLPDGTRMLFTSLHPTSPRRPATWRRALTAVSPESDAGIIRDFLRATGMPALVPGDFNSTPQGRVHREFRRTTGLIGWTLLGRAGTWPSSLSPWLSLPIDRIWTSPEVQVTSLRVGPRFRSDHRPIVADLELPARVSEPPAPPEDGISTERPRADDR